MNIKEKVAKVVSFFKGMPKKDSGPKKPRGSKRGSARPSAEEKVKPLPMYEGAQVLEVLEENVNGMFHHCKMSDGTTKHVPIELFK